MTSPLPGPRIGGALARAAAAGPTRLRDLADWLAIPSVSGGAGRPRDLRDAACFLEDQLRRAGAVTAAIAGPGAPVVVGCAPGPPRSPVVLLYGHYDVQPAGPGWTSAPFRPALRGGRVTARGANDDKGQLFAVLAAMRAWREAGGTPSTVVVIAEGAEEIGSPGLRPALARVARRVRPDVVLACDTEQAAGGIPAVTVSQRGHATVLLRVDVGGQPVHAGRLGGAVIDPSAVLARALLRMQAAAERGPARPPGPAAGGGREARPVRARSDAAVRRLAGGRAVRSGPLDRLVTQDPAVTVVWMQAGAGRAGAARAAVPSQATASLDLRLPPAADVPAAVRRLRRAARSAAPPGVLVRVTPGAMQPGYAAIPRRAALLAIDEASRAVYGRPAVLVRSGGSLPAARLLADAFGRVPVLLGLGTPGGGAHGPDEHLDVTGWTQSVALLVRLLARPLIRPSP